jgi:hypothetical protein
MMDALIANRKQRIKVVSAVRWDKGVFRRLRREGKLRVILRDERRKGVFGPVLTFV